MSYKMNVKEKIQISIQYFLHPAEAPPDSARYGRIKQFPALSMFVSDA